MPKALVTGGTGFIGSFVVKKLLEKSFDVNVLAHSGNFKNLKGYEDQFSFFQGDFGDTTVLDKALEGVETVVHLAWSTVPENATKNPIFDIQSNLISGITFLKSMVDANVKKVVFISSGGTVYGNSDLEVIPESHPLNPISAYGISKMTFEKYLGFYENQFGLDYTVLRVANAYGPFQNLDKNQGVIGTWLNKLKNNHPIHIWGDGSVVRDYIYAEDIAEAVLLSAQKESMKGIYNVGSGEGNSLNDIISILKQLSDSKLEVVYQPGRAFDVQKNVLDNTKLLSAGWNPKVGLKEGIEKTWGWFS